jgi:hypothetical protein
MHSHNKVAYSPTEDQENPSQLLGEFYAPAPSRWFLSEMPRVASSELISCPRPLALEQECSETNVGTRLSPLSEKNLSI